MENVEFKIVTSNFCNVFLAFRTVHIEEIILNLNGLSVWSK